jgi:hypothetical protein
VNRGAREGQPGKDVDKWEEAMSTAVTVSQDLRDAETKRQTQFTDEADSIVEEAMAYLKHRLGFIHLAALYLTICHHQMYNEKDR